MRPSPPQLQLHPKPDFQHQPQRQPESDSSKPKTELWIQPERHAQPKSKLQRQSQSRPHLHLQRKGSPHPQPNSTLDTTPLPPAQAAPLVPASTLSSDSPPATICPGFTDAKIQEKESERNAATVPAGDDIRFSSVDVLMSEHTGGRGGGGYTCTKLRRPEGRV